MQTSQRTLRTAKLDVSVPSECRGGSSSRTECSTKCCAAVTCAPGCGSAARSRLGTISGVNRRSGGHSATCSDSTSPRLAKATQHGLSRSIRCVAEPTEERCQQPSCSRGDRGQHSRFLSKPNVERRVSAL